MSVPTWERTLSKTQYLYETYRLNVRIGQIVMNKPTKYRPTYGDKLINMGLDAMRYGQAANLIYMDKKTSENDYSLRRKYLQAMLANIDGLSTIADIFLALNYNTDGGSRETLEKNQQYIGSQTKFIHDLVKGVMDSDTKLFRSE